MHSIFYLEIENLEDLEQIRREFARYGFPAFFGLILDVRHPKEDEEKVKSIAHAIDKSRRTMNGHRVRIKGIIKKHDKHEDGRELW